MSDNYAKVKSSGKWASDDDAGDLLAGILDDTETAAQAEQARLEAAMRQKKEEQARLQQAEEDRKRHEAEERLRSEQNRQHEIKQRRTAKMEALRVEDLKASGQWVDPAIAERERQEELERQAATSEKAVLQQQMQQMQQQMTQMAQTQTDHVTAMPAAAPQKKSKAPLIALAAVVVAVIGAAAVIGVMVTQQYQPDATNYPKVALEAVEAKDVVSTAAFTPLPKEEEKVEVAVAEPVKKTRSKRKRKSSSKPKKSAPKKKGIKLDLGDDDLFGGL